LATGFKHPLLGLDHLLLAGRVRGFASFTAQRCCSSPCQALVGAPCSASAVASLPLAETGRGLAVLAARSAILRSPPQAGARPHPLTAGGDGFQSPFTPMLEHGHEPVGATAGGWVLSWPSTLVVGVSYGVLRKLGTVLDPAARWNSQASLRGPRPGQIEACGASCRLTGLGWQRLEQNLAADPGYL